LLLLYKNSSLKKRTSGYLSLNVQLFSVSTKIFQKSL
jgi:hypothetical protein